MKLLVLAVGALVAAALACSSASADVVWLCKPGAHPNPCRESNKTTIEHADGSTTVADTAFPRKPPVDCFYVYPTVSGQPGMSANKDKDPEEIEIARYQAARFSLDCKVYAPVYRQLTLAAINTSGSAKARAAAFKRAYGDVREAWHAYLKRYNHGRGVVFIGHSQGAFMLRELLRREVDRKPKIRRLMVSGLLLGGNVVVRKGKQALGDFRKIPGCTKPAQTGCVIAYSTFGAPPPDDTSFGKPAAISLGAKPPSGARYEVLCTNPGSLGKNKTTTFTDILRTEPFPGAIGAGLNILYGGPPPTAATPWLEPKDEYAGRCEHANGANVLMVHPVGASRPLTASPTPAWGLHLADVNLPLGQLLQDVARQAKAWVRG
jgi:hypothetical protein